MSAHLYHELHCDHEGCGAWFTSKERRADITRAHAAAVRWAHGFRPPNPPRGGPARSLDYCPVHRDDIGDLRTKALPEHARPA